MSSTGRPEFETARPDGDPSTGALRPGDPTPVSPERPNIETTSLAGPTAGSNLGFDDGSAGRSGGDGKGGSAGGRNGRSGGGRRNRKSGRSRRGRRVVLGLTLVVLVAVGYYAITLGQVWATGRADDRGPADAIVVMGAAQYDGRPSPQLAARLDHVAELWPDDVAPLVVVTGGNIPGDRFTEAEASAAYLTERGVPESALVLENEGSTSYESLAGVADLLRERGLDSVVIVTDPYHALRSKLIAEEVGLDASVSSTDTSVVTGGDSVLRHLKEAGGVAVGRIIGFHRLSDIVD